MKQKLYPMLASYSDDLKYTVLFVANKNGSCPKVERFIQAGEPIEVEFEVYESIKEGFQS